MKYHPVKTLLCIILLLMLSACDFNFSSNPDADASGSRSNTAADSAAAIHYLDQPLRSRVSQRGLYRLVRSGGLVNDAKTSTGKAVSKPVVEMVTSTQRIPLIKGAQMYLQYRIWYFPDIPAYVDLRRVLKHPPMKLPNGRIATGSDYMIKGRVSVNQIIAFTGYGLDEDYELVEGDWVFEIWHQDRKLVEQKFTTYRPDEEELARLKPKLKKQASVKALSPQKPFSKFDWPGKV